MYLAKAKQRSMSSSSSYILQKFFNHFIFSEPDIPNEDDVIEEIKVSTLDALYNYKTQYYNDSLLHIAVYYNQHKTVKALLDKKFYVDYKNNNYETPLHYACIYTFGRLSSHKNTN
jgi:ankyrin repeat protein